MLKQISKLIVLACLLSVFSTANLCAFVGDEKKKPAIVATRPKTDGERVIITTTTRVVEDEICDCTPSAAIVYSTSEEIKRTIFKPFKIFGNLFKSKN